MTTMELVVFACVHNAGRSQMAAALFNRDVRPGAARAVSAGTRPGPAVHPVVIQVMSEVGLDLSAWLITMGCGDECPVLPGVARDDWPLPDPGGRPLEDVRTIRDDIGTRVAALLAREGWAR